MSNIPEDLKYTQDHEWIRLNADGTAVVGITDYAQTTLGDVTYVELHKAGEHLDAGQTFGVVESVKAASDVYMPVSGTIRKVNESLNDNTGLVNTAPYGDGFMIEISVDNPSDLAKLLTPEQYKALV